MTYFEYDPSIMVAACAQDTPTGGSRAGART